MATPNAPPTSRVVSFIAEPTPALPGGSDPMIDSVAGTIDMDSPTAMITRPPSTCQYPDVGVVCARYHSPPAPIVIPTATRALVPTLATSWPATGATTMR